jgi:hypothetical protein
MTAEDLAAAGFTRALWIPSRDRWYLCPDGLRVVSEEEAFAELSEAEALAEIAEVVGDGEDEHR